MLHAAPITSKLPADEAGCGQTLHRNKDILHADLFTSIKLTKQRRQVSLATGHCQLKMKNICSF
jgi:hypothetical protein